MKKLITLILTAALLLSFLTSCTGNSDDHIHTATGAWECDAKEHWHVCEDGTKLDIAAHTLNDMDICEVCNTRIIDLGDGSFDIDRFNEYDDIVFSASYDSNGQITHECRYELEYDENGHKTHEKHYDDGILCDETYYTFREDDIYPVKNISYQPDGFRFVNEYDENGDNVLAYGYDENGEESYRVLTEYAESDDGERYESKQTEYDYENDCIYISEYNALGDQIGRKICTMDGTVTTDNRYEYGYDEDGHKTSQKEYLNGTLVFEILSYGFYEDEEYSMRYPKITIDYYEDGSKSMTDYEADGSHIVTEYDANGNLTKTTSYDAQGNEITA